MAPLQTIDKNNVTERIVETLQNYILSEKLAPGTKLPTDRELVDMLGCSRTVTREAMKTLQAMGLITIEQGRGTFVKERSWSTIAEKFSYMVDDHKNKMEVIEARAAVETILVELAVKKGTDEQIAQLEKIAMKFYDNTGDSSANDIDVEFHQHIMDMADNTILASIRDMTRQFFHHFPGYNGKVLADGDKHMAIVEAIKARDVSRAKALINEHILSYMNHITEKGIDQR